MQLAARATAARRAAAPGDLIHIPFDQRGAGQGPGQKLFQTPPKLEDVTSEAAELFSGPLILHSLILYYIQERRVKTKNRRLKGKCQRRATEPPRPRGVPWVPQLVSELQERFHFHPIRSRREVMCATWCRPCQATMPRYLSNDTTP